MKKKKNLSSDLRERRGSHNNRLKRLGVSCVAFLVGAGIASNAGIAYVTQTFADSVFTIGTIQAQVYTGDALTPSFTVRSGGKTLKSGTDYAVTYKNNAQIGLATVEVTGIGTYSGTASKTFTIKPPPVDIQSITPRQKEADVVMDQVGGGVRYQARITKKDGSFQYTTGDSNRLTVKNLEVASSYPLEVRTIKAVGDTTYYGSWSAQKSFSTHNAIDIKGAVIEKLDNYTYTPGKEWKPVPKISYNGIALIKGKDFDLSYMDNENAGTATVTATGKGIYTGSLSATFFIAKRNLSTCMIPAISPVAYAGKEVMPDPGVRYGTWMKNGVDYTISYKNNIEIGKGTAILTGKGNFTGSVSKSFSVNPPLAVIKKIDPGQNTVNIQLEPAGGGVRYVAVFTDSSGNEIKSYSDSNSWTATRLSPKTSYTLQIRTFKTINGYTYCGEFTPKQTITTKGVSNLKDAVIAKIDKYTFTPGKEWKPVPEVSLNGKVLKRGTDYVFSYKNNTEAGIATITATGKGIYEGTVSTTFTITPRELSTCYIPVVQARDYTGKPLMPDPGVRYGNWLTPGVDYDLSFSNNTEIGSGTAEVVLTGKKNFKGSVSRQFTVRPPAAEIDSLETGDNSVTAVLSPVSCPDKGVQWQICVYPKGTDTYTYVTSCTNTLIGKNIPSNMDYCIKARLIKKIGDLTVYGAWSQEKVFSVCQHYHDYVSSVKESATCTGSGIRIHTCKGCGEKKTEAIPATGHKLRLVPAKAATCTGSGQLESYTCRMCGIRFSDKAGKRRVALSGLLSLPLGHEFEITKRVEPTLEEKGAITWTCKRCGKVREETIMPLRPGQTKILDLIVEKKKITASLLPVSGNVSYELYVRRASEANGRWIDSWESTLSITDLTSNMDYMVKARTYVEVNGVKSYGDWTEEIPVHTKEFTKGKV